MSESGPELFDIYFAGECLDGFAEADVRAGLKKLFRADDATLDRLFSGSRQRLKKGCDKATALTYQKAMTGAGARPIITRARRNDPPVRGPMSDADIPPTTQDAGDGAVAASTESTNLELSPVGSDVLRPEERPEQAAVSVATDHLSVAAAGTDLADRQAAPTPAAEAPDLAIAELGSDLAPPRAENTAAAPDTSAIELSPEGHSLEDCAPPPSDTPDLALDHLEIADAGSDLGGRREAPPLPSAPDVSHLDLESLADSDAADTDSADFD